MGMVLAFSRMHTCTLHALILLAPSFMYSLDLPLNSTQMHIEKGVVMEDDSFVWLFFW